MPVIIGVIGGGTCTDTIYKLAEEVGRLIAERGAILICGGLAGVMEAACKGAKRAGGTTIGVLPGTDKRDANPYVDIPIVTAMSIARNNIIVRTADGLIAIDGEYGTLSEIAIALNLHKPVIALKSWSLQKIKDIDANLYQVADTPAEAVEKCFNTLTLQDQ
jgi:hypothetical protein